METIRMSEICGKNFLFSGEILGLNAYERLRIFLKDQHANDRKEIVQRLMVASASDSCCVDRQMISSLVSLLHFADNRHEVSLAITVLRKLYQSERDSCAVKQKYLVDGPLSPKHFHFGPIMFRLLHTLDDPDTSLSLFADEDLKSIFHCVTCVTLLMDMLYNAGRYAEAANVPSHAGFSPSRMGHNSCTLLLALYYKLNTADSWKNTQATVDEIKAAFGPLSRRSLLFAASLALKQGVPKQSLNYIRSSQAGQVSFIRNVEIMALAMLGETAKVTEMLETEKATVHRHTVLYSDTVALLKRSVDESKDEALSVRLLKALVAADSAGLVSPQTTEHYVCRPIELQRRKADVSRSFKADSRQRKSPLKQRTAS